MLNQTTTKTYKYSNLITKELIALIYANNIIEADKEFQSITKQNPKNPNIGCQIFKMGEKIT